MADQQAAVISPDPARRLWLQVTVAALGRLLINTSRRFIYPYAPVIGRGLGMPLTSITALIALNQFTGILSPVFGPFSDRWGYRVMMIASLGLMALGMLSSGFFFAALVTRCTAEENEVKTLVCPDRAKVSL